MRPSYPTTTPRQDRWSPRRVGGASLSPRHNYPGEGASRDTGSLRFQEVRHPRWPRDSHDYLPEGLPPGLADATTLKGKALSPSKCGGRAAAGNRTPTKGSTVPYAATTPQRPREESMEGRPLKRVTGSPSPDESGGSGRTVGSPVLHTSPLVSLKPSEDS